MPSLHPGRDYGQAFTDPEPLGIIPSTFFGGIKDWILGLGRWGEPRIVRDYTFPLNGEYNPILGPLGPTSHMTSHFTMDRPPEGVLTNSWGGSPHGKRQTESIVTDERLFETNDESDLFPHREV
jgi:hypothetical protein